MKMNKTLRSFRARLFSLRKIILIPTKKEQFNQDIFAEQIATLNVGDFVIHLPRIRGLSRTRKSTYHVMKMITSLLNIKQR